MAEDRPGRLVTDDVQDSIQRVVDYLYSDEALDYAAAVEDKSRDESARENHILRHIERVQRRLGQS